MVTAVLPSLWYSSRTSSASRSKKPECTKRWPGAKDLSWSVSARHRTFGCHLGRGAGPEGMQWPNHLHLVHADLGADRCPRRFRGGRDGHAEHESVGSAQSAEYASGSSRLLHAGTQGQCVEADPVARPLACLDVHVETQVGQVCEEARAAQADAAAQGGLRGGDDAHRADGCDDAVRLISAAANHKKVIVSVSSTPLIFVHGYWHGSLQAKFIVDADAALPANPTTVSALDASHSPFLSMPDQVAEIVLPLG